MLPGERLKHWILIQKGVYYKASSLQRHDSGSWLFETDHESWDVVLETEDNR